MKKIIFLLIFTFWNLASCEKLKDFGDTNLNPDATNTPITEALLTDVLSGMGELMLGLGEGLYCQYFSETMYPELSCYAANRWSPMEIYYGQLYDLQNIINTNTDEETRKAAEHSGANANQIAISKILKAYIYWTITDCLGDIAYSDALKGEPILKYDTQEYIYKDLIKELTEAVGQFTTGAPVKGDIIYNGNTAEWKKLANSLRMLMALNLSERYPGPNDYSAAQFRAALEDPAGSIENNSDNFRLNYPGGAAFRNPYYNLYRNAKFFAESATMTSIMTDSLENDRRQSAFGADLNGNPSSLGVPYGRARSFTDPWCQQHPLFCLILAPSFRQETSSLTILKASSVLLARAEAAERGWTSENTESLYKAGIKASFTMWGLPAPEETYFEKNQVALGPKGSNLKQIALQQYVAYYPDGLGGWNTWRRTGWPALKPAPDALNFPKVIPRRAMYGSQDYSLTAEAIAEAVARLAPNGDKMDSRVWWDKD